MASLQQMAKEAQEQVPAMIPHGITIKLDANNQLEVQVVGFSKIIWLGMLEFAKLQIVGGQKREPQSQLLIAPNLDVARNPKA